MSYAEIPAVLSRRTGVKDPCGSMDAADRARARARGASFQRDRARAARDLAPAAVVTAPGPRRARIKRVPAGSPRRARLTETRDTGAHPRSEGRVGRRAQLTDEIIDVPRRGTSGSRLRPVGGQAQMPQDAFRDARARSARATAAATALAVEHVDPKRPPHQLGPQVAAGTPSSCGIISFIRDRTHGRGIRPFRAGRGDAAARHGARGASKIMAYVDSLKQRR
jgi:hypothetical protein